MTMQHPSQWLFTSKHPLMSSMDIVFDSVDGHVLSVTVTTPQVFAREVGGGIAHTGFTTLFMDTVMGAAVLGELKVMQPIATVKLTTNHLRSAKIGESLVCKARYDGESSDIAYVSGEVYSLADDSLVATAVGSFMIGTTTRPLAEKTAPEPAGEAY